MFHRLFFDGEKISKEMFLKLIFNAWNLNYWFYIQENIHWVFYIYLNLLNLRSRSSMTSNVWGNLQLYDISIQKRKKEGGPVAGPGSRPQNSKIPINGQKLSFFIGALNCDLASGDENHPILGTLKISFSAWHHF
jgi:hypothetical protein